jgi:hypothetical protein
MIEHCLYGVKVFCEFPLFNRPVPLSAVAPAEHPTLALRRKPDEEAQQEFAESIPFNNTHGRELFLRTDRLLSRSTAGQPWCLEVQNVVIFTWSGGEPVIHYQLQEEGSQALLVFWFVHIFLPLHLTLERGWDFIHSAAVEINDQPVLFIAPSTGGKSTLGDYFLKRDHPMLSDDKVATFFHEGEFWAVPSHPHHRPFREFEVLGYPVENFAASARPIHAFYLLEAGEPDSALEITEIEGFRKFEQLLPNYLFSFSFLQQQRMRWLAQLADQSLVFKVRRPWALDRMHEVYDTVCAHSRSLQRPGS